jgi:hypothetical protein
MDSKIDLVLLDFTTVASAVLISQPASKVSGLNIHAWAQKQAVTHSVAVDFNAWIVIVEMGLDMIVVGGHCVGPLNVATGSSAAASRKV